MSYEEYVKRLENVWMNQVISGVFHPTIVTGNKMKTHYYTYTYYLLIYGHNDNAIAVARIEIENFDAF